MRTVPEIIDLWPSAAELARRLGEKPIVVQRWRSRGRIPAQYLAGIVRLAESDGINLTFKDLALACAQSNGDQGGHTGRGRQGAGVNKSRACA